MAEEGEKRKQKPLTFAGRYRDIISLKTLINKCFKDFEMKHTN